MSASTNGVPLDERGIKAIRDILTDLSETVEKLRGVQAEPQKYSYGDVMLILDKLVGLDIRSKIYLTGHLSEQSGFGSPNYILKSESD